VVRSIRRREVLNGDRPSPIRGELTLLDGREGGGDQRPPSSGYGQSGGYGGKTAMPQGASGIFDDEIPF